MSSAALETYLARLYTETALRERFLADPRLEAQRAGLNTTEVEALANIDTAGLCMAANSYARKRKQHRKPRPTLRDTLARWLAIRR
jgi:hypothetical protein